MSYKVLVGGIQVVGLTYILSLSAYIAGGNCRYDFYVPEPCTHIIGSYTSWDSWSRRLGFLLYGFYLLLLPEVPVGEVLNQAMGTGFL